MRILLLSNRVPWPLQDGGAIAMFNMVKGFHELGHTVDLLCLNTRKHHVSKGELPALFRELHYFEAVDINTDVTALGALRNLFSRQSYHISRFYSKAFADTLRQLLQVNTYDVIQLELLHMALYLDVICQHSTARVALRAHNVEHIIWERLAEAEKPGLKRAYLRLLAGRLKRFEIGVLNRFDALIPITEQDAGVFRSLGCRIPMHVSPTGLDMGRYTVKKAGEEWPSIFHFGALNWMPNQQGLQWFLEKVWPAIHQKYPSVPFYIAGRDMPDWIRQLHVPGVQAVGEVPDAVDFYNSKALMVVPLLSGSGMRIKIIEGMAMGKAIISTSIGVEGIPATHGQDILIADSPAEFIQAIERCLDDKIYAGELGRQARILAEERFSNQAITAALVAFYEKLVAGN